MCGIAGYIHKDNCTSKCEEIENISHKNQACRGPDSRNSWKNDAGNFTVHLFHQRLRIQDLSTQADQPMHSRGNQDVHIVYNGEIYNSSEVKNAFIPNETLTTHSDTEILAEALCCIDPMIVLNKVRGMFAIGSYNSKSQTLELMRDYFGEKPLHYTYSDDFVLFASQFDTVADGLKSLGQGLEVDQTAIYKYLILGYFPFGASLYKNILKVKPGALIRFSLDSQAGFHPECHTWTSPWSTVNPIERSEFELEQTLSDAVSEQLIGDVPIGVFLSGGVDSTLVSALAQKLNSEPIHSFSLGFEDSEFDESEYARKAARRLGTHHHALQMTGEDAANILPDVLRAYPEPLGDPSVFPTTFISREARKEVTVVLTGDGADELFFGYGRYARFLELQRFKKNYSHTAKLLKFVTNTAAKRNSRLKNLLLRMSQAVTESSDIDTYLSLVAFSHYKSASNPTLFESVLGSLKSELVATPHFKNPEKDLRELDVRTYLVDDILVKVDRAAMAYGLETRAPFLDRRVADMSSSATTKWLRENEQKHVLKEILSKYVSEDIFRRSKMGFGAPIGEWLRTTLRPWGEETVHRFSWESIGVDSGYVQALWTENLKSSDKSATYLWILLSLASSVERFK